MNALPSCLKWILQSQRRICLPAVMFVLILITCQPACANADQESSNTGVLKWTLVIAVAIALIHLLGPKARRFLEVREAIVNSFGGGMAIAYVFLRLLPELDLGHRLLGDAIHFIVLFGFVFYYCAEHLLSRRTQESSDGSSRHLTFSLYLGFSWIYSWLIVYAMPGQIEESGLHAIPILIALGLHLLHKDYSLGIQHGREFDSWGRYVLALAPLAGWLADTLVETPSEAVSDVLIALLAGSVLYNVFKEELPDHPRSSVRWFIAGVIVYVLLYISSKVF